MVGRIITIFIIAFNIYFAKAQANQKFSQTIEPFTTGLYTFSKYSQIDTRFSDGKSNLLNELQGNSGYSKTANYLIGIKYQIGLKNIKLGIKYEFGNLKTNIKFVSPTISNSSNYQNFTYIIQRHSFKFGIELPEIFQNEKNKFDFFTGVDFGLSFTNKYGDSKFNIDGKSTDSDTGYLLLPKNEKYSLIKVFSKDYNYNQTTVEIEPYFKGTYNLKRIKIGLYIFMRLALIDHANILSEYYASTLQPISQLNSASSTGFGGSLSLLFPIKSNKNHK